MQGFDAPTLFHECRSEPAEEFWVRGPFACAAEVIWIAGEGLSEVRHPKAIDDGARGEWIFCICDPIRERFAAAFDAVEDWGCLNRTENAENAWLHSSAGNKWIATSQDMRCLPLTCAKAIDGHSERREDGFALAREA